MKYLQLILLVAGVHMCHGYCDLGHLFQPVSSEGTPCNPQNLDCIRLFFVNTWVCLETEGLLPLLANVTEFEFPAPSNHMSATGYDIEIKGLQTGRSIQIYNRTSNNLIITTEWPRINIIAKKVVIHRPGKEDVTVTDFEIRFDYILILGYFTSTEITITRNLKTHVEKVYQPAFQHSRDQSAEELNHLFDVLLQDVTLMIQKLFVVRAADFVEYLKANNLCRPHGFLNTSDSSICGPTSRRRRDILETNSTISYN